MKDLSERIYLDYLSELDGLERFRQRFQERHPAIPLEREDPDVRRLIEAMAYFSVQTRNATMKNLRSTWRRLFAGFFDFLLEPVPASAMIQALPGERMAEVVELPRGTEIRLAPADGKAGAFRLQRDLRVLPVYIERSEVVRREGGFRLIVTFRSRFTRPDPVGVLSLHVRHLDEYRTSLAVFHALQKSLERVSVVYNEPADAYQKGLLCKEVSFSRAPPAPDDAVAYSHPLQRLRSFFQLPEQQLFVHIQVPTSPVDWERFSLCFDLKSDWRTGNSHHPDFFVPFSVPVTNLKREPAQVITADGTRTEYAIRSVSTGREFSLHSVQGVYELTKAGRAPLRPSYLPDVNADARKPGEQSPSYEIDETIDASLNAHQSLIVHMPEAFTTPRKLQVEALWYQPGFAPEASGRIKATLPGRHIDGLEWQVSGEVKQHLDSHLQHDMSALVHVLSMRTRSTLTRDDLIALLNYLGTPMESPFRRVLPWLRDLTVTTQPDGALRGTGIQHLYKAEFDAFDPSFEPLVVCFLDQVRELLDVWNNEATVELRATVAGRELFPPKKSP
ncbi:type VI secretion system baseplate subunit TssF [Hyalangium rubrum]|uniref:Type VI secretion system baseplate subunit TssF n=1 Tax=Hyalangium rubrum TaxID=3103134 RepID=A0ABU5HHZ1_9BACT|nr:type VI secretion system baseplate subunit TssF [Hyalangium sp. s54d21]MDY7233074.1 type VI secretion system baseplate subunit TssF [Hyalangium sp. s54d21]